MDIIANKTGRGPQNSVRFFTFCESLNVIPSQHSSSCLMCLRQHFAKLIKITVRFLYRVGMQIDKIVLEVGGLTKCARFDSLGGSFRVLCSAG